MAAKIHNDVSAYAEKLTGEWDEETATRRISREQYEASLPEGVTPDLLKKIDEHLGVYLPAATLANGKFANQKFAENPDLKTITTVVEYNVGDELVVHHSRETESRNPSTGAELKTFGATRPIINSRIGNLSTGQMGAVRAFIKEEARDLFGKIS